MGPRTGLDGSGKFRPHRDLISGPSITLRVAIPTELTRSAFQKMTFFMVATFRTSNLSSDKLFPASQLGRDSSVGIVTRYGLDDPGIESRCGRDFLHPSRPALGPTQPPIQWVPSLYPGVKRPGRGVDHPPPCAEVKERVEQYFLSTSGPSWPAIG